MPSIAALDRRCFLERARARTERCFLVGRVPLRPLAVREAAPAKPAERGSAPASA